MEDHIGQAQTQAQPMATNSKHISTHQSQTSTGLTFLGADTHSHIPSFSPRPNLTLTSDVEKLSVHSPLSSPRSVSPSFSLNVQGSASANSCTGCLTDCGDPGCSDLQITDQCTDRCVVVCNDANLGCHGDLPFEMCDDTSCEVPNDCINCSFQDVNYFDCCAEPNSHLPDPKSSASGVSQYWGPSAFDAFLCGCAGTNQFLSDDGKSIEHIGSEYPSIPAVPQCLLSSPVEVFHSYQVGLEPAVESAVRTPDANYSNQSHIPQNVSSYTTCMWGDCQASFPTLEELVTHVNQRHLRGPEATDSTDMLSCLWGGCNTNHSISGPSSGVQPDHILGALTSHLLQDHLGLYEATFAQPHLLSPSPIPPSHGQEDMRLKDENALSSSQTISSSLPGSPPPSTPHIDSIVHCCRWHSCSRTFSSCDELTAHLSAEHVDSGKPRYDCFWEGCNRSEERGFFSKQKICRHLQSHTGHRPFQCSVCEQFFSEAATLQQHMRRHTQEKPYQCDFPGCGKAFSIPGALTIHKRTHNGLRPFKCSYCDKGFAESSNLAKHLRTHTGARPYTCQHEGCGKSFARTDQLSRHSKIHERKRISQYV